MRKWGRLTAFLEDPAVWLDNNPTERAMRGPVIGRRNHFGSKSVRGPQMAAILYSLVETAKVCGLDPIAYLLEVATRARRTPGATLLPADFKREGGVGARAPITYGSPSGRATAGRYLRCTSPSREDAIQDAVCGTWPVSTSTSRAVTSETSASVILGGSTST